MSSVSARGVRAPGNPRFLDMPHRRALVAKFTRGARAHAGGPGFHAIADPAEEAYQELLDAEHYLSIMVRRSKSLTARLAAAACIVLARMTAAAVRFLDHVGGNKQ